MARDLRRNYCQTPFKLLEHRELWSLYRQLFWGPSGADRIFPGEQSGHLVIFQQLMGLKEPVLLFDISVHVGTLAAIFCYYFKDILRLAAAFFRCCPGVNPKVAGRFPRKPWLKAGWRG
ncbi:MAG: undecaprenyl-diphosphate phosphatase [Desulfobacterales bacterium]